METWQIDTAVIEAIVTAYWRTYYRTEHCTLCANHGVIDSRGIQTPAGVPVGRRNYCVCPNGQALRRRERWVGARMAPKEGAETS